MIDALGISKHRYQIHFIKTEIPNIALQLITSTEAIDL